MVETFSPAEFWAVVDIGVQTFTSRPVILGRMKTKSGGGLLGGIFSGKKDEENAESPQEEPTAETPKRAEPPSMKKKDES